MRIYIAGKISGIEQQAKENFANAELLLKSKFPEIEVVNPMNLPHNHDKTWKSYMVECIKELLTCDAIYALDNCHESRGAMLELHIALNLKMHVFNSENIDLIGSKIKMQ